MDVRVLGGSEVSVSRIGLGGFELGPEEGDEPDVDRAVGVLTASLDAGVNWLDTSENYLNTNNESLIGAALAKLGTNIKIATKAAPGAKITGGGSGFRPHQIHQACLGSLRRLGRDVIDMYFLHWPDESGVPLEDTWGAMAELVDEGLVRAIGMSNYELAEIENCNKQRPVDVVQTGLSMIDYLADRALVAECGDLGISVVIYEPLGSGILTGRSLEEVRAIWTGPWVESAFYQRLLAPGNAERSFAVVDGIRPIAAARGWTVAQAAIAWVLAQPGVSAAIAGSRDGRHMRENAEAAAINLAEARAELEALITLGPGFA
ncbi:MAG TPA: aldo/keto reductase [Actinomycetes bacterium]|nr:aldo/keto reductase [Actinomycetes bacterium]